MIASMALVMATTSVTTSTSCPSGATKVDDFTTADGIKWLACEDLASPS